MQEAAGDTVLGNFGGSKFAYGGIESTFFRRDGRFFVNTDGPDSKPAEFEIRYTFGLTPLQQYLIAMPGGRLQALGIAWDSRPRETGGQRWFHLYSDRTLRAGDPLHWTGIDQCWNYQCADCHATDLRKGYDEKTGTYQTTWSEIGVSCEACHGPGSDHVAWARSPADDRLRNAGMALSVVVEKRRDVNWIFLGDRVTAMRSWNRGSQREIETCARCHARRDQFSDEIVAGQPFHDGFRPSLVVAGLYHADGQQREEVYTYGSFLQSKMYRNGVTCSDCHEPHAGRLRRQANEVCTQCHKPEAFDTPSHHHHPAGSSGAACKNCHMPTTTYMGVDPRHDHGIRVPRPSQSSALGTPNACAACHTDRPAAWVEQAMRAWYPTQKPDPLAFAQAFQAGERGAPGAQKALLAIVGNVEQPPFVRASALARLARFATPSIVEAAAEELEDGDPNVRMAATAFFAATDAATRLKHLTPRLSDRSRVVRMDAARALAGQAEALLAPADRQPFEDALSEYVAAQRFNADRPESAANLGALAMERGRSGEAESNFRRALALDPTFVHAAVNLADLFRMLGREADGERVLRDSTARNPGSAALLHALGLSLVRQKRTNEALQALCQATNRDTSTPRFAYVYAVALHDSGEPALATEVLESALRRHPFDRELLIALASYDREAGREQRAIERERLLRELEPEVFHDR